MLRTLPYETGCTYDVIGDIHGFYDQLHQLLEKLGYTYDEVNHRFDAPPNHKAIFMGDYIDRGPKNLEVISLVKNMTEAGSAHAIMGNHEFNAVLWATPHPDEPETFIRPHDVKNYKQHKAFLDEVENDEATYKSVIEWFKSLPIFLKIGNLNFVHACWQPSAAETLVKEGIITQDGIINDSAWLDMLDKTSTAYLGFEVLMKGPEEYYPDGLKVTDHEGSERRKGRIAWWRENPRTLGEAYTSIPLTGSFREAAYQSKADSLSEVIRRELREMPAQEKIFIGHLWEHGTPKPLSERVCCVDYSVAKGGSLVSYQVTNDTDALSADKFTWVNKTPSTQPIPQPAI